MADHPLLRVALLAYANEPCGICGDPITEGDLLEKRDVTFTGYRQQRGRVSRTSHGACWRGLTDEGRAVLKAEAEDARTEYATNNEGKDQ